MDIRWKLFDKNTNEFISNTNYVIACDGGIRKVNYEGDLNGTLQNRHLIPLMETGVKDVNGKEIVCGHIVEELKADGREKVIGYVSFYEGTWYVVNDKEKITTNLYYLEQIEIIGHVLKDSKLNKILGI